MQAGDFKNIGTKTNPSNPGIYNPAQRTELWNGDYLILDEHNIANKHTCSVSEVHIGWLWSILPLITWEVLLWPDIWSEMMWFQAHMSLSRRILLSPTFLTQTESTLTLQKTQDVLNAIHMAQSCGSICHIQMIRRNPVLRLHELLIATLGDRFVG